MTLEFSQPGADVFVPDGTEKGAALERTTHMCIGAHQDDTEFMAYHGIAECFHQPQRWFTGVVMTNGAGSPRSGVYGDYSDEQMQRVRQHEQRKAAFVGEYGCQVQLMHPSSAVKAAASEAVRADLRLLLSVAQPQVLYLHNPADKHDTHVASVLRVIEALRSLPAAQRPQTVYGCEIWRDLDWLADDDKQVLPVDRFENLAAALSGVFDSQITGGKRYDRAIMGRRMAHATFFQSHETDESEGLSWAMDLTPLVERPELSILKYTLEFIERFKSDVVDRVGRMGEGA